MTAPDPRSVVPARLEPETAPAAAGPSGWALRLRVASAVLFVPLLILLARAGGAAFVAFVAIQLVLGLLEFFGMMRAKGLHPPRGLGLAVGLAVLASAWRPDRVPLDVVVSAALLGALIVGLVRTQARIAETLGVTAFGVLYVGWLSSHLVLLRELPWRAGTAYADGASFVLLAFFVTWSCDTAAYLVGRKFGRTRPWRKISPRKSLEGAAGGFVAAVGAALVAKLWFAPFLSWFDAAAVGVLGGVFGQVGDLVESLIKRDARHDDSSDLIPGHGGVLDRFDSLYFAAPIVYYYLRLVVYQAP